MHNHHIVPKHAGGTDDPSNIEPLTIQDHAEKHRILYETYDRWQDKLAWESLSGQIDKEEIIKRLQEAPKSQEWKYKMSERMRGAGNNRYGKPGTMLGKTMPASAKEQIRQARSHNWEIVTPNGTKEAITNLSEYCRLHDLQQTNMVRVSKGIVSQHKGYTCKKLLTNTA